MEESKTADKPVGSQEAPPAFHAKKERKATKPNPRRKIRRRMQPESNLPKELEVKESEMVVDNIKNP